MKRLLQALTALSIVYIVLLWSLGALIVGPADADSVAQTFGYYAPFATAGASFCGQNWTTGTGMYYYSTSQVGNVWTVVESIDATLTVLKKDGADYCKPVKIGDTIKETISIPLTFTSSTWQPNVHCSTAVCLPGAFLRLAPRAKTIDLHSITFTMTDGTHTLTDVSGRVKGSL